MKQIFTILLSLSFLGVFAQKKINSEAIPNNAFLQKDLDGKTQDEKLRGVRKNSAILFTQSGYRNSVSSTQARLTNIENPEALKLMKDFTVILEKSGDYYLLANTLSTYLSSGNFQEIKVYVNAKYQGVLNSTKGDWEVIGIKDKKTVTMTAGKNLITFEADAPFYPEVDCIQLASSEEDLIKQDYIYNHYVKTLANKETPSIGTRSAFDGSYNWTVTPQNVGASNTSKYYYTAWAKVPVVYTYHRRLTLKKERNIFHTTPVAGDDYYDVDTYMHLYKIDDPNNYSWFNDNYTGNHSRIDVTPPAGDYYLVIRSKINSYAHQSIPRAGLVNVYWNGTIANEGVPVSGYMLDAPVKYKETLNYFTGKSTGSPRIFLLDGNKMLFNSEEYTYYPPADFYWFDDARKKIGHRATNNNWKMLITSIGAWSVYYGNCDVYSGLRDAPAKYMTKFPNLKSGDAILTGDDNSSYNAAAWAGGIINQNVTIGGLSAWSSWDNYFGNNPRRYAGAETFSRSTYGQLAVVLYSKNNDMSGASHFATTNGANMDLHGFAYESKIGTWGRITHTNTSLNGTEYGSPYAYYYKPNPTNYYSLANTTQSRSSGLSEDDVYTLEQSIGDGLTIIEDIDLDPEQQRVVNEYQSASILSKSGSKLGILFENWKKAINSDKYALTNNTNDYIINPEGKALIEYGKLNVKESVLFFADIIFNENQSNLSTSLAPLLFAEIAADKYGSIITNIKEEWSKDPYTDDGAYIFPSYETFAKKYIKEIINGDIINKVTPHIRSLQADDKLLNTDALFNVLDNPVTANGTYAVINLPSEAKISLSTVGLFAGRQHNIIVNKVYPAGEYRFRIDYSSLSNGVNVCTLNINGQIFSRKLLKK